MRDTCPHQAGRGRQTADFHSAATGFRQDTFALAFPMTALWTFLMM